MADNIWIERLQKLASLVVQRMGALTSSAASKTCSRVYDDLRARASPYEYLETLEGRKYNKRWRVTEEER